MKVLIISFMTSVFMFFSAMVLADKLIVRGSPVVIEEKAGVYVPVTTTPITTTDSYYFVTGGNQKVCYYKENPALVDLNGGIFRVKLGDDTVSLHCYDYNPDYFIVE